MPPPAQVLLTAMGEHAETVARAGLTEGEVVVLRLQIIGRGGPELWNVFETVNSDSTVGQCIRRLMLTRAEAVQSQATLEFTRSVFGGNVLRRAGLNGHPGLAQAAHLLATDFYRSLHGEAAPWFAGLGTPDRLGEGFEGEAASRLARFLAESGVVEAIVKDLDAAAAVGAEIASTISTSAAAAHTVCEETRCAKSIAQVASERLRGGADTVGVVLTSAGMVRRSRTAAGEEHNRRTSPVRLAQLSALACSHARVREYLFTSEQVSGVVGDGTPTMAGFDVVWHGERVHRVTVCVPEGAGGGEATSAALPPTAQTTHLTTWGGDHVAPYRDALEGMAEKSALVFFAASDRPNTAHAEALVRACAASETGIVMASLSLARPSQVYERIESGAWGGRIAGLIDAGGIMDPRHPLALAFMNYVTCAGTVGMRNRL